MKFLEFDLAYKILVYVMPEMGKYSKYLLETYKKILKSQCYLADSLSFAEII